MSFTLSVHEIIFGYDPKVCCKGVLIRGLIIGIEVAPYPAMMFVEAWDDIITKLRCARSDYSATKFKPGFK